MIICSALYYPGSLARGPEGLVRDNRYYPGKAIETLPVWWQYLRRHYPTTKVVLFMDEASPVPIDGPLWEAVYAQPGPTEVVRLNQHAGQYFRPMQRNLVEAIKLAYTQGEDLFWLDADAFLNTDIRPLLRGADVASSGIQHFQQTMGSVCFYISARRLHTLDALGIDLPAYLTNMVDTGPENARMHALQEGGLYKTFCYGHSTELSHINLSHLSCYPRFMRFLRDNPLDTEHYRSLVAALEAVDFARMPGVEVSFTDMLHTEAEGAI